MEHANIALQLKLNKIVTHAQDTLLTKELKHALIVAKLLIPQNVVLV